MEILFYSFLASVVVMVVSLSGLLFTISFLGSWLEKNKKFLVIFASGVFLVTAYTLVEETIHLGANIFQVLVGLILGVILIELLAKLLPNMHHHHGREIGHRHSRIDIRRMLIGDGVHNIGDGFLIFSTMLIDWRLALGVLGGILIHELVQEVSEFFVLKESGLSTFKSLVINFTVSTTVLIGVVIAWFVSSDDYLVIVLLLISASAFIYVVFRDLIPSAKSDFKIKPFKFITFFLLGILLMSLVSFLSEHSHEEEVSLVENKVLS